MLENFYPYLFIKVIVFAFQLEPLRIAISCYLTPQNSMIKTIIYYSEVWEHSPPED